MIQKAKKPAPPCQVATGSIVWESSAALALNDSKPLSDFQEAFIAHRFGLNGVRARLTAELAWGCR